MLNKVRLMPKYITSKSHVVRDQLYFISGGGGGEGGGRGKVVGFWLCHNKIYWAF